MAGSSKDPQLNQLATKFYARFMQVILESRIPAFMPASSHCEDGSTSTSGCRAQGPAFNIALGKFGAIIDRMEPWCKGVREPMVIDILFSKRGNNRAMEGPGQKMVQGAGKLLVQAPAGIAFAASGLEQPILLERWTVEFLQHHSRSSGKVERETDLQVQKGQHLRGTQDYKLRVDSSGDKRTGGFSGKSENAAAYNVVEKKMAILMRSVYCTARLLPAQSLFRLLSTSGKCNFKLSYKVLTSPSPLPGSNSKDMTGFYFTPIEINGGVFRVSVTHRRKNPSSEREIYTLCPQIITDYIGRAATLTLNQLPTERTEQLHSLPLPTQRLSSFKFDNLQLHRASNKEVAIGELDHTVHGDFSLVEDEGFECPFAINDEQYDIRMEKLRSVKSDSGGYGRTQTQVPGGPLEVFLAFQRPAAPLSGAYQPKKDAANSLKELKMYIDFKDRLMK